MKKTGVRSVFAGLLCLLLAIGSFAVSGSIRKPIAYAFAEGATVTSAEIDASYGFGEAIAFPATVSISYDENTYVGQNPLLVYPDGSAKKVNGGMTLDAYGRYSVRYYFDDANAVRRYAVKTFTVNKEFFSLSADNGSTIDEIGQDTLSDLYTLDSAGNAVSGLELNLAEGCQFVYNKPINLANAGANGLSKVITIDPRFGHREFIEGVSTGPKDLRVASLDAYRCVVRLTDCYDPDVYVDIKIQYEYVNDKANYDPRENSSIDFSRNQYLQSYSYFRAGASGQLDGGIWCDADNGKEQTINQWITWQKEVYIKNDLESSVQDRAIVNFGNVGTRANVQNFQTKKSSQPNNGITFWYDSTNNRVRFSCENSDKVKDPTQRLCLINDLSNADIYGTSGVFKGFTTGEVYVSVFAEDYVNSSVTANVLSIGYDSGATLVSAVGKINETGDVTPPTVEIDAAATEGNMVYAAKGDKFVIPSATAFDVNLTGGVNVNVYRKYGSESQSSVLIEDGKFDISVAEKHYIVYTAKDTSGNEGKAVLIVNPVEADTSAAPEGKFVFRRAITLETDKLASVKAGTKTDLPDYTAATLNLGERLKVSVEVKIGGEKVAVAGKKFTPLKAGTYTVTYYLSDNAVSYAASYDFECLSNEKSVFIDTPSIPKYYIKNAKYDIPTLTAYTIGTETIPSATAAEVFVKKDGGDFIKLTPEQIAQGIITVDASEKVQYKFTHADGAEYISNEIKVTDVDWTYDSQIDADTVNPGKYFVYSGNTFKLYSSSKSLDFETSYAQAGGSVAEMEYINALPYDQFSFTFSIFDRKTNFTRLDVVLSDASDSSRQTVISFEKDGVVVYVSLNGNQRTALSGARWGDINTIFGMSYDATLSRLVISVNSVSNYIACDGEFGGQLGYLALKMSGIENKPADQTDNIGGNATIRIRSLCGVALKNDETGDLSAPLVSLKQDGGYREPGSIVTVYAPVVTDLFSPVLRSGITFTVKYKRNFVTSIDGVLLDGTQDITREYQIRISDEISSYYTVSLTVYDSNCPIPFESIYTVEVIDYVGPVIKVANGYENKIVSLKVGTTLKIDYTVTDNNTEAEYITSAVHILKEDSNTMYQNVGKKFTFRQIGTYTVYIHAYDEAGNIAVASFTVKVTR